MADQYFKTVGEAWAAMTAAFTAYGELAYVTLDFAIEWHTAGAPNGGYWTVSGDVYAGEQYANGNYFAQEAKTGALLPFVPLSRQPGMAVQPMVTSDPTAGRLTAQQLLVQLYTARMAMLADVSDVISQEEYSVDVVLTGAAGNFVERELIQLANAVDQSLDIVSVTDMRFAPTGAPATSPIDPVYMVNNQPILNNIINTAPSFDLESTVNPGGAIYSITSRQVTTP